MKSSYTTTVSKCWASVISFAYDKTLNGVIFWRTLRIALRPVMLSKVPPTSDSSWATPMIPMSVLVWATMSVVKGS
jgi:hypothetical protein